MTKFFEFIDTILEFCLACVPIMSLIFFYLFIGAVAICLACVLIMAWIFFFLIISAVAIGTFCLLITTLAGIVL